jgi:hypothetical protein
MSKIAISPGATGNAVFTIQAPSTETSRTLTLPDATGTILSSTATTASVLNVVTNKIAVNIGGVTYYLLASTSGT